MFSGSIPALVTPFKDGSVDEAAFRRLIDWQIEQGSSALVPCGTTGEAPTLSNDEQHRLFAITVEQSAGRVPVMAGCGSNDTQTALWHMQEAKAMGADAALMVAPYYNRPSQAGLLAHFSYLAEKVDLPIVLYNVPGRTGCDMQPDTVAVLRSHANIIGLKEAVGDENRWAALYPLAGPEFSLLSGDDPTFVRAMAGGARGVISVASNVVPAAFAAICRMLLDDNLAGAQVLDARLRGLYDFLGIEPNPVPVKALMRLLGFARLIFLLSLFVNLRMFWGPLSQPIMLVLSCSSSLNITT